jgi:hypothetical protein
LSGFTIGCLSPKRDTRTKDARCGLLPVDSLAHRKHLRFPRRIRDRVDYQNTTKITGAMAGLHLTPGRGDYFDLLCRLIEDYDRERLPRASRKITGPERI